jgi:hypothetical protein
MKTRTIDEQIRDHYESQRLSPEKVEEIRLLRRGGQSPGRWRLGRWAAVAAVIIVAIGAASSWLAIRAAADPAEELAIIAARDHNRRLDVEIDATTFAELQVRLANLEFNPVMPEKLAGTELQVTGARYSTIDGAAAIEIKLLEPSGGICTLIQLKPGERLGRIRAARQFVIDGLLVDVWQEKGLVMALARTA